MLNSNPPSTLQLNAEKLLADERARYLQIHPRSISLSKQANQHFLYGVPMHWMNDWGTPTPLFVERAQGAHFTCADGIDHTDFCLGDTGELCLVTALHQLQKQSLRKPMVDTPQCYPLL